MEIAQIDYLINNLRETIDFLEDLKSKQKEIESLKKVSMLKDQLDFMIKQLHASTEQAEEIQMSLSKPPVVIHINDDPIPTEETIPKMNDLEELTKLRKLLFNDNWPPAIDKHKLIDLNDDHKKNIRAGELLNTFVRQRIDEKTSFLDFGCGEGHTAYRVANDKRAKISVGYDIQRQGWERFTEIPNFIITERWGEVASYGPYNIILIFDVLDHSVNKDPEDSLIDIRSICGDDSQIFIRCHPWTSKHGTHLYRKLNKAYPQLVFTNDEMRKLGFVEEWPTLKIIHPISQYREWFKKTGFEIIKEEVQTEEVSDFFVMVDAISERIKSHWKKNSPIEAYNSGKEIPKDIMKIQYVDFVLKKI